MKKIQWIKSPENKEGAALTFSKIFEISENLKSATVKISSVGVYNAFVNGERLGEQVLTPGYTSYVHRIQYQAYDVTEKIQKSNKIEISAAPGWAVGHLGYDGGKNVFADHVSVVAEIELTYENGEKEFVNTDATWSVSTNKVTYSDIYMGETFDALHEPEVLGAAVADEISAALVAQVGEDIKEQERIAPVELITTPKGERVIDFGQNMTGYVEFNVRGKKREKIVTTCAEVLDKDGNFYNDNYRTAKNEVTYILDGKKRVYKPQFTFQGFRYVRLDEYPDMPVNLDDIRAVAVHSDIRRIGYFSCGEERINQLYHNIIWGQKSNYLDIPTDCPQRDERLGWTGDAQVFCRTAAMNYDVRKFFEKWLGDLRLEQRADGAIYGVCPEAYKDKTRHSRISAAWGDAAVIIPWELYRAYGDKKILADNFEMMKKWVNYQRSAGSEEYLWLGGYHYGDWLAMDAGGEGCVGATANDLIASAFYANAADIVVRAGEVLGEDVSEYRELHKKVVAKFRRYFLENGLPKAEFPLTEEQAPGRGVVDKIRLGMTQTALVLLLRFNLCTKAQRAAVADKLEELIMNFGGKMSTGFVGTPYILHVLTECGKTELAYKLLFANENPSWLYSVEHGATTMWEHWNGIKEDGSFWSDDMNSYNHYAYGSVGDWLYGVVAGITVCEDGAGYKKMHIAPRPCKKLGFVNCEMNTVNGKVESNWYYKGEKVYFEITVPHGAEAKIILPNGYTQTVNGGTYHFVV
ncbi:MAG: family 78 glycoside hydrolase catalytic domain [Clostridia bacterium]|nr:family 78 glycoside hydrolase catalytic domain [Clostridia bacterium]